MNKTATNTHPLDSESLRLQLEEDGKKYCANRNSKKAHKRLLRTLQTNDCREIITATVDGDDLSDVFAWAGDVGHVDILDAFLNHGMNIDIKDQIGRTALICASYYEHEECIQFLLDRHANTDIQDKVGFTPLMWASDRGHTKIVEMLLEKHANPDLQSNNGMTALMFSSPHSYRDIVQVLLDHSPDIELKRYDKKTALDLADDEEIKELLLNHVSSSYVLK